MVDLTSTENIDSKKRMLGNFILIEKRRNRNRTKENQKLSGTIPGVLNSADNADRRLGYFQKRCVCILGKGRLR